MAYRFQPESTLEANVRRILGEQLDKARYQLTENYDYHPAEAIHDTGSCANRPGGWGTGCTQKTQTPLSIG